MTTEQRRQVIAQRLRMARENAGLSQSQAAAKLDLQRPAVSEMEAGRRRVSADEITVLAALYHVDTGWLAGDESDRTEEVNRVQFAARELAKLKPDDLNRVIELLKALRKEPK